MAASSGVMVVRRALLGGGAVVLPLGIVAIYLLVSRRDLEFSVAGDYLAFFVAIAVGAVCLWYSIGRADWRRTAMVLYLLIGSAALFMFALTFLCSVFGECL
jgi:hypothetical protein